MMAAMTYLAIQACKAVPAIIKHAAAMVTYIVLHVILTSLAPRVLLHHAQM